MIQEYVPGKQLTIAHLIANPDEELFEKMGIVEFGKSAIGIATVTPSEAVIIAVDIATKNSNVEIGFLDRFSGSMVIVGTYSSVKSGLEIMIDTLKTDMGFDVVDVSVT